MKAITFNPETDQFALSQQSLPTLQPNDVLIQVEAAGLNPVDAKITQWKGMVPDMNADWIPGLDVSGYIEEVGSAVIHWQKGDRVVAHGNMLRPYGAFAEFSVQDADTLVLHPEIDAAVAAASPCAGWTAYRALVDKLRVMEHTQLLINGGSGGVGSFAVQLAAHFGVETLIATCSGKNTEFVRSLGATHVLDYRSVNVPKEVMRITENRGVEIALDTVGGKGDELVAQCLGFEGQMVELVKTVEPVNYPDAFLKGLSFHQLSLGSGHRHGDKGKEALRLSGEAFTHLLVEGAVKVPELQVIAFDDIPDALEEVRQQRTVGKLVAKH